MFRLLVFLVAFCTLSLNAMASVNINSAAVAELQTLPGIGPSKASAIIDYRTQNGPFLTVDDLDNVPGIGPATLGNLRSLVSTDGTTTTAATGAPSTLSDTSPLASTAIVNVNTATADELVALPGIGPSKASAIVADRTENGPFTACSDLSRVRGIGPATVANISPSCEVQ